MSRTRGIVAPIVASLAGSGGFAFLYLLVFADQIPRPILLGTATLAGAGLMGLALSTRLVDRKFDR
jgi:hypothetical protein